MPDDFRALSIEQEKDLGNLRARMDADILLLYLDDYIMRSNEGNKTIPDIINVTLNRPGVFAQEVLAGLGDTTEQPVVETEDKNLDELYIEDFQRMAFSSADERMRRLHRYELNEWLDFHNCIRGRTAVRCVFQEVDGVLVPDLTPWDMRYVTSMMGADGELDWAAFKGNRTKDVIEAEWGKELEDKKINLKSGMTEVMDVWHRDGSEFWVKGQRIHEQEHDFGFCPVVLDVVGLGSMAADIDVELHIGESIFYLIRVAVPELNRLVSILQTLNFKIVKPPLQEASEEGRLATPEEYDNINAAGGITPVDIGGGISRIDFGDAQRSATLAFNMMSAAMEEGSISSLGLGRTGSPPPSGILAIVVGEGRDKIFSPRLKSRGRMKRDLAAMITKQVIQIGGTVELGTEGHKRGFQTGKLEGQYETFYTYSVNSQSLDAGRASLAAAYGNLIPDLAKSTEILQRKDPKGDLRQLRIERAERDSPAIKLREEVLALIEDEQFENARLLTDEAKIRLAQLLEGNIEQTKPQPTDEPTQVLSLFGGSQRSGAQGQEEE